MKQMKHTTGRFFYRRADLGTFIAQEACTRRDISWHIGCSRYWWKTKWRKGKSTRSPFTRYLAFQFEYYRGHQDHTSLTYSIEQSPVWEAYSFSASQEIPHILLTSNVHYRFHNSPSPVPILNQRNPVHSPSNCVKIHFNIVLPLTPRSSKCSFSPPAVDQNPL